jgi:hypothetical protein
MKYFAYLRKNIQEIKESQKLLVKHMEELNAVTKKIEVLRRQAWEDGFPGSNDALYKPLFDLEDAANSIDLLVFNIKELCKIMRNKRPEEWN